MVPEFGVELLSHRPIPRVQIKISSESVGHVILISFSIGSKALFSIADNLPRSGEFLQIRRKNCLLSQVNFSRLVKIFLYCSRECLIKSGKMANMNSAQKIKEGLPQLRKSLLCDKSSKSRLTH